MQSTRWQDIRQYQTEQLVSTDARVRINVQDIRGKEEMQSRWQNTRQCRSEKLRKESELMPELGQCVRKSRRCRVNRKIQDSGSQKLRSKERVRIDIKSGSTCEKI